MKTLQIEGLHVPENLSGLKYINKKNKNTLEFQFFLLPRIAYLLLIYPSSIPHINHLQINPQVKPYLIAK